MYIYKINMIGFTTWTNNYIDILNIIYTEFLKISMDNNITILDNSFNDFCTMIYYSSQNIKLRNPDDFDYVN